MNCSECKANRMPDSVPYIVHESAMARSERKEKRMFAVIVLLILLLVGSNCAWLWYESSFEDVTTTTIEADATDGGNAIANGDGSVNVNGEG